MPATAATMATGTKKEFNAATLTNPETNIGYGVKHLRDLLALYKGNQFLAIAAYNAGAGNVNRWRKAFGEKSRDEFIENIPFCETREYVKKVLSSAGIYSRLYKLQSCSCYFIPASKWLDRSRSVIPSLCTRRTTTAPIVTAVNR